MSTMELYCRIDLKGKMEAMRFHAAQLWQVPGFFRAWRLYEVNFEKQYIVLVRGTLRDTLDYWWRRIGSRWCE